MIVVDATVVNVALPTMQRELHFSTTSLAWVVNGYLLTFGGLLLLAGRLGDRFGREKVFLSGVAGFTAASILCGASPDGGMLVGTRFVQGAGAAAIAAMTLGIIITMFRDPKEQARALGIYSFVTIIGSSLGVLVGGALTEFLNWRWIFFVNVPVGLFVFLSGRRLLDIESTATNNQGSDVMGAVLVTLAPALAVYGLANAGGSHWKSPAILGCFAGSVVLLAAFVFVESKAATPLIPIRIIRNRTLGTAALVRTFMGACILGRSFLVTLYLQEVLSYSPLNAGLALIPSSVITGIVSILFIHRIVGRFGPKPPTVVGLALMTASLLVMVPISPHSTYLVDVLPGMLLMGLGVGLLFMPSVSIVMSAVEPSDAGVASGVSNLSTQMGGTIGVTVLAVVSASYTSSLLVRHYQTAEALTDGYRLGFMVAGLFGLLSVILAIFLLRPQQTDSTLPLDAAVEIS